MSFGERVKEARNRRGLTQGKLGDLVGVQSNTVYRWEAGGPVPGAKTIKKLSDALGVSTDFLLGEGELPRYQALPDGIISVPILSKELMASAGFGNGGMDQITAQVEDFLSLPASVLGKLSVDQAAQPYIVYVDGDSMEAADIPDGSQVVVNPAEEVYSGDVALVCYGRERSVAVKWVYWQKDGGAEIRSASLLYPPKLFDLDDIRSGEFRILGKVVRVLVVPRRGA